MFNAGLFNKLKDYRNSGGVFGLVLSFVIIRQLWMVLGGNFSQDYSVNAGAPKIPFVVLKFPNIYLKGLPVDVFGNITIYADDTTFYSKCYQASDLWQQLDSAP